MGVFEESEVRKVIELPEGEEVAAILAIGHPAEQPQAPAPQGRRYPAARDRVKFTSPKEHRCKSVLRLSKNFVFSDNLCFGFAKHGRPKVPMRKLSPLNVSNPRYTPPVLMRLRSKRFFSCALPRLLFRRENRLYQQTESTDANLCSFCVWDMPAPVWRSQRREKRPVPNGRALLCAAVYAS